MLDVVFKRKPRENIKVCVNVSRTSYRQATDRLPTHYQQSADCRPTGSQYFGQNMSAVCRPIVDRQSADRFFGELFFTITERIVTGKQRYKKLLNTTNQWSSKGASISICKSCTLQGQKFFGRPLPVSFYVKSFFGTERPSMRP